MTGTISTLLTRTSIRGRAGGGDLGSRMFRETERFAFADADAAKLEVEALRLDGVVLGRVRSSGHEIVLRETDRAGVLLPLRGLPARRRLTEDKPPAASVDAARSRSEPRSGCSSPATSRSRVDLPVPLRPTSPIRVPAGTCSVAPSSRGRPAMRNVRSLRCSMAGGYIA
jgi:hypothetical protein